MSELGKVLIFLGVVLVVAGFFFILIGRTGLGKLPGDVVIRREHFTFYFPIASSIILSIILSLVLWLIFRYRQ